MIIINDENVQGRKKRLVTEFFLKLYLVPYSIKLGEEIGYEVPMLNNNNNKKK